MGYVYGKLGATGDSYDTQKRRSTSRVTSTPISPPIQIVTVKIEENEMTVPDGRVWKGVSGGVAQAAWRVSFEPGYIPVVISPRGDSGAYDPNGSTYSVLTEKMHAQEVAAALAKEGGPIPKGIYDTLKTKLGIITNDVKKTNPPTGVIGHAAGTSNIESRSLINRYTDGLKMDTDAVGVVLVVVTAIVLYLIKKN